MTDLPDQANVLIDWLNRHGITIAIAAVALLLVYRWARPLIHRTLVDALHAQATAMEDDPLRRVELDKRVSTVEDLVAKILRATVVVAMIAVLLGTFELWPLLAGFGVVLAAITLAGQDIVLDYLMGTLILVEGQYFKGDTIRVGAVEGTVEEVGLRRTVIRDTRGTMHSISNGLIRSSANRTRSYAIATVHISGIPEADVERVIVILDAVGQAIAGDDDLGPSILERPGYAGTTGLTAAGATLSMSGRVEPERRVVVEAEMRRRVAAELGAAGIDPIRPVGGTALDGPTT